MAASAYWKASAPAGVDAGADPTVVAPGEMLEIAYPRSIKAGEGLYILGYDLKRIFFNRSCFDFERCCFSFDGL